MKVNIIELCAGYSSQCLGLEEIKRLHPDFDYDCIAWSEFDPDSKAPLEKQPAVIAHDLLFPQFKGRNLGDMTKIDWSAFKAEHPNVKCDILVYSTPCQSISQAGLQHGFKEGSGTRSSILWNTIDAVRVMKPDVLIQENVAAIVSKKFKPDFDSWCEALEREGYTNYYQLMNAKDYGVPQNRLRLFMISIKNGLDFKYQFPSPIPLTTKLSDLLEEEVPESYYLCDESVESYMRNTSVNDYSTQDKKVCGKNFDVPSLSEDISSNTSVVNGDKDENGMPYQIKAPSGRVYNLTYEGDVPRWRCQEVDKDGNTHLYGIKFRIRKLTPRECFRLMDVPEHFIDRMLTTQIVPKKKGSDEMVEKQILSNSALYKLAGNSICVCCLEAIYENLYYPTYDTKLDRPSYDSKGNGIIEFEF